MELSIRYLQKDSHLVPSEGELLEIFLSYFRSPELREFLESMAASNAQGYFRPFTLDEDQSIGVTFPKEPESGVLSALMSDIWESPLMVWWSPIWYVLLV